MAQGKEPIQNKPGGSTKDPTVTNYSKGINPFTTNVGQESFFRSGDKTNLDLTNPTPFGGPINASRYQHQHLYTPEDQKGKIINNFLQQYSSKNTYLNSLDGVASNIPSPPPQPTVPATPTVDSILPNIPKDIGSGNQI